ncbi:STAS domain-containing protein [Candidatus Sumerlaeota bacterium]|nr:STAS domain-containing protein [Candidatus Sumerlaeota bacterium]
MQISIEENRSSLLVALEGDLTSDHSDNIHQAIRKRLTKSTRIVCLDLRRVAMIDSAGLSVLLGAKIMCGSGNARLRLFAPSGTAFETLEAVGFDKILNFVDAEEIEPLLRNLFGGEPSLSS